MSTEHSDPEPEEHLTQWLVEAGRRRYSGPEPGTVTVEGTTSQVVPGVSAAGRWDRVILAALLAIAYLIFFFADVLLQTTELRSLIVFIPPG